MSKKFNNKIIWLVIILAAIVLSQWLMVKLVYAHKIEGQSAYFLAKTYKLKAGTINEEDNKLIIPLTDYLTSKDFTDRILASGNDDLATFGFSDVDSMVWDGLVRNTWVSKIAQEKDIEATEENVNEYLATFGDVEELASMIETELGLPFAEYKETIVKPFVLESMVYSYLISNYNDLEGISRADTVYQALDSGEDFIEVGRQYSDDMSYIDNSLWVTEDKLVDFYEPIKELEVGEFSKIIQVPIGYVIWYLESTTDSDEGKAFEVNGIFISGKTLDHFLQDYLANVKIERKY